MILRLKSEVFHTKPTLWIHHQTKTQTKKKGSFSKRERGKERENKRGTKRKRESDEIQVVVVVYKKYTRVVLLHWKHIQKLLTTTTTTYMRAASIACQRKSSAFFVKRMPVTTRSSGGSKKASMMMMSEGGGKGANIRVTTYNVLSSHLAEPTYFTSCDPKNLDALVRLERVQKKLSVEMEKRSIIGLQEVSMTWSGPLHAFFAKRGYHVVSHLYGKPFNNYMGVLLAIPLDTYELSRVDVQRLSDCAKWPRKPKDLEEKGVVKRYVVDPIVRMWRAARNARPQYPPQDDWELAKGRFNSIVYANVTHKQTGVSLGVSTYHMPCMFRNPKVMTLHSALAATYTMRESEKDGTKNSILMGDFNVKPIDGSYELLTTNNLDENDVFYPIPYEGTEYIVEPPARMVSCYKEVNGEEPDFTNYAKIKDDEPFIDTLDYIFVTENIRVDAVAPLKHRDEVTDGPYPSENEPSDHVLLAADVTVF